MSTLVKTGKVRFCYVNVLTPRAMQDDKEPSYSMCILIDKKDKTTLDAIKEAYKEAVEIGKVKHWKGKVPAKVALPLRDGDEERADDPAYEGKYFINVRSKTKPQVVKKEGGMLVKVDDPMDIYSGCYGKVTINLFPYLFSGNAGVGAGLNNVFTMVEGDHLAGSGSAMSDFEDEVDNDDEGDDDWMKG